MRNVKFSKSLKPNLQIDTSLSPTNDLSPIEEFSDIQADDPGINSRLSKEELINIISPKLFPKRTLNHSKSILNLTTEDSAISNYEESGKETNSQADLKEVLDRLRGKEQEN